MNSTTNNTQCDQKIYKYGTTVAELNVSKEEAEKYCEAKTQETGVLHDWHYVAGRVIVKGLYPSPLLDAVEQNEELLSVLRKAKSSILKMSHTDALEDLLNNIEAALMRYTPHAPVVGVEPSGLFDNIQRGVDHD